MLHLTGCALLTAFCAFVVPAELPVVVASGTLVTVASYVVFAVMRNTLDESTL